MSIDNPGGGGTAAFIENINEGSLTGGIATITHSLGTKAISVTITRSTTASIPNEVVLSNSVIATDNNNCTVDMNSFRTADGGTLSGTYEIRVAGSGGFIQPSGAIATQADAEAGVNNTTDDLMTPLRVKQAIDAQVGLIDNSGSGYVDIGTIRIQWGSHTGSPDPGAPEIVSLPTGFANSAFSIVGQASGYRESQNFAAYAWAHSATQFKWMAEDASGAGPGAATVTINWMAIGIKP